MTNTKSKKKASAAKQSLSQSQKKSAAKSRVSSRVGGRMGGTRGWWWQKYWWLDWRGSQSFGSWPRRAWCKHKAHKACIGQGQSLIMVTILIWAHPDIMVALQDHIHNSPLNDPSPALVVLNPRPSGPGWAQDASWCNHTMELHLQHAGICDPVPISYWRHHSWQEWESA